MARLPLLEDLPDVQGKHVLVRTDFNVPITNGVIDDDLRIRAAIPTLQWLIDHGATVSAASHLGRPKGKPDSAYSMDPVRARLAELIPEVTLLENLRFDAGEEANDPAFASKLVEGFDAYVNDAFGASHRAHASIVGPPTRLPSAAGRLLQREIEVLGGLLDDPARPFVAVMGGAKVSDKLGVIEALLTKVDTLLVGGGMGYTFLAAQGHEVGDSLCQPDYIATCKRLLDAGANIVIPQDVMALTPDGQVKKVGQDIEPGWDGRDIGPATAANYADEISKAKTVLWNGPMGVFEDPRFAAGTRVVAESVASTPGFSVVGGGDSASAMAQFGLDDQVDHISTGGGASLEYIEQGDLPGLAALRLARNAPE